MEVSTVKQCNQTNVFDAGVDWDVYDWNVGVSRLVDATFSCMVLIVFVNHGCQLLFRLLWISAISVFIWCVRSWLRHCDSTRSSFVWASPNSSSLICFSAISNGSNGPKLLIDCFVPSPSLLSFDSDNESTSSNDEQVEHFETFS